MIVNEYNKQYIEIVFTRAFALKMFNAFYFDVVYSKYGFK